MEWVTYLIALVIALVFAAVCWNLAGARDRNQPLWAILGFFFPIIALIVLLIIGKSKPKTAG
jgi:cell division protein FtsW (lipid II flippase)